MLIVGAASVLVCAGLGLALHSLGRVRRSLAELEASRIALRVATQRWSGAADVAE